MSDDMDYSDVIRLMTAIGEKAEGIMETLGAAEREAAEMQGMLNTLREQLGLSPTADVFGAAQAVETTITEAILQANRVAAITARGVAKLS